MIFIASLLVALHEEKSLEKKSATLHVVTLGKALHRAPVSSCGREAIGPNSLPVTVAQPDSTPANQPQAHTRE